MISMNVEIDTNSDLVIGADIGGSNIRVALVDSSGNLLVRKKIDNKPSLGIEIAGEKISQLALEVSKNKAIKGMGFSSAGPINQLTGEYLNPPNLSEWNKKSLIPIIRKHTGIESKVGHDATLAALAEINFGKNKGSKNLIYLTISTGVGAGMISNGNMIQGENWFAGEVGHIIVSPGGYGCSLGCPGCLEGNISGTAIASIAKDMITNGHNTEILENNNIEDINSKLVIDFAQKKDKLSEIIINDVLENLGRGLASILATLNPSVIILGGSVAEGLSKFYWNKIIAKTAKYSIPFYKSDPPIQMTTLGEDASILGASIIASS
ncbi:MAG: ROK family protein [SAR202 cluster bacterium]|nr:ROK family protein [SAR202 cluster bacterium]